MQDGVVGVQVAVRLLSLRDQVDQLIRRLLVLLSLAAGQAIGHSLQPLVGIRVAEHRALALAAAFAGGDPEVFHAVRLFHAGDTVVQHLPLVGQELLGDHIRIAAEERIGNPDIPQCRRNDILLHTASNINRLLKSREISVKNALFG